MIRVGAHGVRFPGPVGVDEGDGDEIALGDGGGRGEGEGVAEDGFYGTPDLW